MYNNKDLLLAAASIAVGILVVSPTNAQDAPCRYTVASLQGSYTLIGYYAGGIGLALALETIDGEGKMVRTATVNQPMAGSTTGERTRTKTMSTGNYTVNCEGTGTLRRMQTNATTGVTSINESDIIITEAVVKDGQFIATALVSAQATPSAIVPSGVFTSMVYTRLPDAPAATPTSAGAAPNK